jgi:hypothetical protein
MEYIFAAYGRFSSKLQLEGTSFDRQNDEFDEEVARLNEESARGDVSRFPKDAKPSDRMILDKTIIPFDKAVSASDGSHLKVGNLGKFIKKIENGLLPQVRGCFVEDLSRLTREGDVETVLLIYRLNKCNIDLYDVRTRTNYQAGVRNTIKTLTAVIEGAENAKHIENLRTGLREAWRLKREKNLEDHLAMTAKVPGWLEPTKKGEPYKENSVNSNTLHKMFELCGKQGHGCVRIANFFDDNKAKYPCFYTLDKNGKRKEHAWTKHYVYHCVKNRSVMGWRKKFRQRPGETSQMYWITLR